MLFLIVKESKGQKREETMAKERRVGPKGRWLGRSPGHPMCKLLLRFTGPSAYLNEIVQRITGILSSTG